MAKKPVMLVVVSKVKDHCKKLGYRIGDDALLRLTTKLEVVLADAMQSASNDKRLTIKDRDIAI